MLLFSLETAAKLDCCCFVFVLVSAVQTPLKESKIETGIYLATLFYLQNVQKH